MYHSRIYYPAKIKLLRRVFRSLSFIQFGASNQCVGARNPITFRYFLLSVGCLTKDNQDESGINLKYSSEFECRGDKEFLTEEQAKEKQDESEKLLEQIKNIL